MTFKGNMVFSRMAYRLGFRFCLILVLGASLSGCLNQLCLSTTALFVMQATTVQTTISVIWQLACVSRSVPIGLVVVMRIALLARFVMRACVRPDAAPMAIVGLLRLV